MSEPSTLQAVQPSNAPAADPPPPGGDPVARGEYRPPGGIWVVAVPAVAALCLGLWGATTLSYDRDEIVTVSMARRPLGHILGTARHYDVVHVAYYVIAHLIATGFGTGEIEMRMPAILGTVAAAVFTAELGRRLISPLGGMLAGLTYPMLPAVVQYSHIARQYAVMPAVAALATLLLLRALERDRRGGYLVYAISIAVLGVLHIFALLLVVAHLLAVLATKAHRGQAVPVGCACAAALIPALPIIVIARHQQHLVAWIRQPGLGQIRDLVVDFTGGSHPALLVTCALIGVGGVLGSRHARAPGGSAPLDLRVVGTAWLLVPPVILLAVSQVDPVYQVRYVLICAPAVALLAAAGAVRLRWRMGPVAVAVALALMIPQNLSLRRAVNAQDQLREAARVIGDDARPGDVVVFMPSGRRPVEDAYPADFTRVRDIARMRTPAQADDLGGTEVDPAALVRLFGGRVRRAWLLAASSRATCGTGLSNDHQTKAWILRTDFEPARCWAFTGVTLRLYSRKAAS